MNSTLERISTPPAAEISAAVTLPIRPRPPRRRSRLYALVGAIFASEAVALLVLAAYGGYIGVLPVAPPVLRVASATRELPIHSAAYCWLTPGHAACADVSAALDDALPRLVIPSRGTMRMRFDTANPTDCAASAVVAVGADGMVPAPSQLGPVRGNTLTVSLAPGAYRMDILCRWRPQPSLRWLRGQGDATYALALTVTAR